MGLLSSINLLWLGSAFVLTVISLNVFKGDPTSEDGLPYILFNALYFLLVIIMERMGKINKERLHIGVFIVGILTIMISQPIHENDHYRYLWEGRVFLSGENPYVSPPNSKELDEIEFDARSKIGFPDLTTIYPPLSLLWFGAGGILSSKHRVGLIFLMLLNALLIYLVFMRLQEFAYKKWLLILLFPFFQKEFIQSIHIDLFSFFWAFLFLTGQKASFFRNSLFVFLSIFTKIIGVFFVWPLCLNYLKSHKKNVSYWLTLIFLIISFPLFYLLLERIGGTSGFKAFSSDWVWNPGFYSFLWRGLDFFDHQARQYSLATFLLYCAGVGFWSLYWFKRRGMILGHKLFWTTSYLFFAGLIFFTPVYNAWYAIWFVVPALLLNLRFGVLYGFFSFTCYFSYWSDDFLPWSEFLGHLFFIPSLIEIYFLNRRKTGIAIFVKTPGLSPVKTRLSATMGEEFSKEFYLRTVEITKEIVQAVQKTYPTLIPYWAVAEDKAVSSSLWANFETIRQGEGGLGDRLFKVYDQLIEQHGSALIIGSDAPLLSKEHILEALNVVQKKGEFVMGPAGDGGFYLIGGSRKVPRSLWTKVQYSQSNTGEQLKALLRKVGNIHELDVVSDVDVKEDLLTILSSVQNQKALLQGQRKLIVWISKCVKSCPSFFV